MSRRKYNKPREGVKVATYLGVYPCFVRDLTGFRNLSGLCLTILWVYSLPWAIAYLEFPHPQPRPQGREVF